MAGNEHKELDLPFELSTAEKHSALWIKIKTELEARLETARIKNDNETLPERETAALRGRIKCLKSILGLGDEPEPLE